MDLFNTTGTSTFVFILSAFGSLFLSYLPVTESVPQNSDAFSKGVDWLSRYGYLPPPDPRTGQLQTREGIEKAIRVMQRFGGIQETGKLDSETMALMKTPRCSLPDIIGTSELLRRRKRYALSGLLWRKKTLSWRVLSYPQTPQNQGLPQGTVDSLLHYALKPWGDVTPLHFERASPGGGDPDIKVEFSRSYHEDGYPFDGPGGTLAHAFFPGDHPISGDTHFDDDETWTYMANGKKDGQITPPPDARPTQPKIPTFPPGRPTRQPRPDLPDRCSQGGFDAIANIRGEVFFFKNKYFWRVQRSGSLVSLAPALISNFWHGLPKDLRKIDAVYERTADSKIIFFIGDEFWLFSDTRSLPGYPKPLSLWGLPSGRVDGSFVWAHNGKTYFFRGAQFWRYDDREKRMDTGYPKPISLWRGIPDDLDDVITWGDGDAYFFKGDQYWVQKKGGLDQGEVTPKSVPIDWMRCPPPRTSPAPPQTPPNPRAGCNCDLGSGGAGLREHRRSHWLLTVTVVFYFLLPSSTTFSSDSPGMSYTF
ncbi:matrix metalloproteinase-25 isoform X2 [Acipenser ruthenus]|uniref:matrix metalloproteinase-25 isoform X2 n=1 Tax=Acipenser ruthenus TaxID=7906 RepID=UPI00274131CA|nr:matrix metalloproteinase-25 isoform X2 [Acipenser ruthenus]